LESGDGGLAVSLGLGLGGVGAGLGGVVIRLRRGGAVVDRARVTARPLDLVLGIEDGLKDSAA
jgi:hypothetical protein